MIHLARLALSAVALGAVTSAQGLDLQVDGGSMPGQIDLSMSGGVPFQQGGMILMSITTGPTPLALFDVLDPRSLSVGLELVGLAQSGPFLAGGVLQALPPIQVPVIPAIVDNPLFFQGVSVPGNPRLVDQLSLPRAVRFAPGGAFRNRFVTLNNPRSFFPVLPGQDGRLLMAGGGAGAIFAQIARKDTEWFDPMSDTFTLGPDMTTERSLHTATELQDGRYLLVGGVDRLNDPQASAEIWDPVTATFTAVTSMVTPRVGHSATLLPDGRVMVAGGMTDMNAPVTPIDPVYSITRSIEIYDPATNAWAAGSRLRRPRAGHFAFARTDGKVLLCGGVSWTTIIIRIPRVESTTDLFDPNGNTISAGPSLRQSRAEGTTSALGGGRWLLAGGVGVISLTQWGTPTARCEVYDEATDTFTSTASLGQQRALHGAFDLGGGRVMVAGGGDGTLFALTPLGSTEIYDASAGAWAAGPALIQARTAFGGYTTATGQLHIVGGEGPGGVDNTTEFYFR